MSEAEELSEARARRLTERDRELIGVLATARYLSTEQLVSVAFPGRVKSVWATRLGKLAECGAGKQAYLRKHWYLTDEGRKVVVWGLTESGYGVAREVMGPLAKTPLQDVGRQFLQHSVELNQVLVTLLLAQVQRDWEEARARGEKAPAVWAKAVQKRFRWRHGDSLALPFDGAGENGEPRRLVPDAVLEIPGLKRRAFLEMEMGTNSIRNAHKTTSTVSKLDRYREFVDGRGGMQAPSAKCFQDGWEARLVFLVRSDKRCENVQRAIEDWKREKFCSAKSFQPEVATVDEFRGRAFQRIFDLELPSGLGVFRPPEPSVSKSSGAPKSPSEGAQPQSLFEAIRRENLSLKSRVTQLEAEARELRELRARWMAKESGSLVMSLQDFDAFASFYNDAMGTMKSERERLHSLREQQKKKLFGGVEIEPELPEPESARPIHSLLEQLHAQRSRKARAEQQRQSPKRSGT